MSVVQLIKKNFSPNTETSIAILSQQLTLLNNEDIYDEVTFFHKVSALIHELGIEIRRLQQLGIKKDEIIANLQAAKALYSQSTFLSRLQNWPRGYQGDFKTIEYICDGVNKTPPNSLAHYLEKIALASPIVQQHKNKVLWQSQQILNVLHEDNAKILSIGCGGCRDLRLIEPAIKHSQAQFILNDIDQGAFNLAEKELESIWGKITPILGDSFRKTREISQHGPFNLIVAGGLFDYLPDRYACALLKKLSTMLSDSGKICFTNILKPNPWGVLIEYLANWTLIERTQKDFQKMFDTYGLDHLKITMTKDSTSLAGLYEIRSN